MPKIRIATRRSRLAMWQANEVRRLLLVHHPELEVELVGISTEGDRVLDRPLDEIGGKGLFIKALELALLEGDADIAVHSLKDVPSRLDEPFELCAYLEREDPRDALLTPRTGASPASVASLDDLAQGARVGSSSLRRQIQLRKRRPDLEMVGARGNVETRLRKLDEGEFDALVLAVAGLKRLELSQRIDVMLSHEVSLPAAGQGIVAVECLAGSESAGWTQAIDDAESRRIALAERHVCRRLDASCSIPLAVHAEPVGDELSLRSRLGSRGGDLLEAAAQGTEPREVADRVADALFAAGAAEILREFEDEVDS